MTALLNLALGLTPVLAFLFALITMDSYKLVAPRAVFAAVAAGGLAALVSFGFSSLILFASGASRVSFSVFPGPVIEEMTKALYVALLIRNRRAGFLVDAGIFGFAVGAGFALVENIYYGLMLSSPSTVIWIIRGFGTAVTHGTATAVFAMVSLYLVDRRPGESIAAFVPGLILAAAMHTLFNLFLLPPLPATIIVLVVMPVFMTLAFRYSENGTRQWLGVGFDTDADLMVAMESGRFGATNVGRHLEDLLSRFPGAVVADMVCLVRIHLELSLRAKGMLLAREQGIRIEAADDVDAAFREMSHLEKTIGPTGLLAIRPFLSRSRRDLWQLYHLGGGS